MSDSRKHSFTADAGPNYPIAETFYSLQGEGYWAGTPAFFIRLAGCSVGCAWCDTNYKKQDDIAAKTLVDLVMSSPARHVVLTGGEPLDHDLTPLVVMLKAAGCFVQLETSGTIGVGSAPFDWITVSPKCAPADLVQETGDECKVVFAWPQTWYPDFLKLPFDHFFIQPLDLNGMSNSEAAVEYVKKHPRWRLSLQTHKILNIR